MAIVHISTPQSNGHFVALLPVLRRRNKCAPSDCLKCAQSVLRVRVPRVWSEYALYALSVLKELVCILGSPVFLKGWLPKYKCATSASFSARSVLSSHLERDLLNSLSSLTFGGSQLAPPTPSDSQASFTPEKSSYRDKEKPRHERCMAS